MSDDKSALEIQRPGVMGCDKTEGFPPEIITRIFALVCGEEVLLPPPDPEYPWVLGHVCSHWREILWNSPSIWTKITVGHDNAKQPTIHMNASVGENISKYPMGDVLNYILATIEAPISLTVSEGYIGDISSIVFENSDRFLALSLEGIYQETLFSLLNLPPNAFIHLEKLSLSFDVREPIPEYTTSSLHTAPNLRSVTYKALHSNYLPPLFVLPWAGLRDIVVDIMCVTPNAIWDIFLSSPSLMSCTFVIEDAEIVPTTQHITLPELKMLDLKAQHFIRWNTFFSPITTPCLDTLHLMSPEIPCSSLASLIIRSSCSLKTLHILEANRDQEDVDGAALKLLLDHLPSMTDLITSWSLPASAFTHIYNGALPNLVNAGFCVHSEGLGAFLDMIDSYIESPQRSFSRFDLACFEDQGFPAMRDRYQARYDTYSMVRGLRISVLNAISFNEIHVESDGENVDDEWW